MGPDDLSGPPFSRTREGQREALPAWARPLDIDAVLIFGLWYCRAIGAILVLATAVSLTQSTGRSPASSIGFNMITLVLLGPALIGAAGLMVSRRGLWRHVPFAIAVTGMVMVGRNSTPLVFLMQNVILLPILVHLGLDAYLKWRGYVRPAKRLRNI